MASVKISNLPSQAADYGLNSVLPIVDSGSTTTSRITASHYFKNGTLVSDTTTGKLNLFLASGVDQNSPQIGGLIEGSSKGVAVIAGNGKITDANSSAIIGCLEASGGNSVYINNGSQHTILSSFRSYINGAERSAIIACQDGNINNAYNAVAIGSSGAYLNNGPSIAGGSQGVTINGNRTAAIGSEGMTINSNMSGSYNSYGGTINGNLYQVAIGSFSPTINSLNGAAENGIHIGTRESVVNNQRATMIATSGRTSLYSGTTHSDNFYSFGRIQSATNSGTSVNNEQFLTGGLGMVQYTTVGAGNLNLKINGVRNGEVYHWVINNDTGSSVSLNSTATDTGFTITDNTASSLTTGPHTFTVVVVDDQIIIEGNH